MQTADVLAPAARASVEPGADERNERRRRAAILYVDHGLSLAEVGCVLDVDAKTVQRDLEAQGIARRQSAPPAPRECALDGCDVVFTPSATQLANGYGKYCSRAHGREAHRKHQEPEPRECALDGCDVVFTPDAWNVAHGWGVYCSPAHARRGSTRERRKGRTVTCAHCGADGWRYDCELAKVEFCSHRCWGRYRWKHGLAGVAGLLSPRVSTKLRRRWKGRWAGRKGGRPRVEPTDDQYAQIRRLRSLGYGRPSIAPLVELSEDVVRRVFDELDAAGDQLTL